MVYKHTDTINIPNTLLLYYVEQHIIQRRFLTFFREHRRSF